MTSKALFHRKVRKRIQLTDEEIGRFFAELRFLVEIIDAASAKVVVPRDRKDDIVLAALVAGQADVLVTGDADLLALRDAYSIVTPAEFVARHFT
ncbi:MAG TPA: putative toxin-antitoxin system toxin component, PIN family [Burkholderiaceae bacterium]|nr:putative toxin-antitoxin system toxin component, PIN family [Burkholderiaceae bacterium]